MAEAEGFPLMQEWILKVCNISVHALADRMKHSDIPSHKFLLVIPLFWVLNREV